MKLNPKMLLVAAIFVALIVGYYWYLSTRLDNSAESKGDLTAVQKVTTENFDQDYPKTPREVIKAYNQIQTCFYNEEYSEEELLEMVAQARRLLDDDLLAKNPEDQYLAKLKADIAAYRQDGKKISNITIDSSNDVRKEKIGKDDYAYVDCVYYVREASSYEAIPETYMLRKDSDGNWKILAFFLQPKQSDGSAQPTQGTSSSQPTLSTETGN